MSTIQGAFLVASGLLLLGFVLRVKIRLLQVIYLPAAVIGGALGLLLAQTILKESAPGGPEAWGAIVHSKTTEILIELKIWPGFLIAVVFAGLYLEKAPKTFNQSLKLALREGIVVWIIVVGQALLGLLAAWLLIGPFFPELPYSFGLLLETGWAGGPGTAAAMGGICGKLGFKDGLDLGMFMATLGLAYGALSGIVFVNLAVRKGWTRAGQTEIKVFSGLMAAKTSEPVAFAKVRSEVLDPLVFQGLILTVAFAVGLGLRAWAEKILPFTRDFPLFIYTLLGGLLVREAMRALKIDHLVDGHSLRRITGAAMEFLIVAAMTSLNIQAVFHYFIPLSILILIGIAWTGFCLVWLSRKLLPRKYWFELGLINYGMSTGVTATGLMLLRIIDKDFESGAAEDYALAAPLSAPFVGGGVITLSMPLILTKVPVSLVIVGYCVAMGILFVAGFKLADRPERPGTSPGNSISKS